MPTMNISLPDEMRAFVEQQVSCGAYSTASEYIRALLREAQKNAACEKLESMLLEGLESGPSTPLRRQDWDEIVREGLERLAARKSK